MLVLLSESPIELRDGRVWVEARVSGHSLWGIFDTGSDGTAIDSDFAQSIGLSSQGWKSGTTVAGDVEVEGVGTVEFDISGTVLSTSEANALPLSKQLKGLEFILGFDALKNSPFVIWPEKRRVVFGSFEDTGGFAFALDGDIRPTATMEILGASSYAFLDTGSAQGISLPRRWVNDHAERLGISTRAGESKKILDSKYESLKFTLEEMTLGNSTLTNVPAEAVESEKGSFAEQSSFWGNVGNVVLQRFESIAIDGRKRSLAFSQQSALKQ